MSNIADIKPLQDILFQFLTYVEMRYKWIPCWMRTDPITPMSCTYEWRDEHTNELLFMVEVSKSGAIYVVTDDWLSKYTMAIHRNVNVDKLFIRVDQNTGVCSEITNVDRIEEGEVIIHFPTLLYYVEWLQKTHYTKDDYPIRMPTDDLEALFFINGQDPLGAASVPLSTFISTLSRILGNSPAGYAYKAITSFKYLPKAIDVKRSLHKELMIEKFYAAVVAQVYWVYNDSDIVYSDRVPNIEIPAADIANQVLVPFIPSLPFTINRKFGNPLNWIYNYSDNYFKDNTHDEIKDKLGSMKAIWEENFNGTALVQSAFQIFENNYIKATIVTQGGRPNLSKLTFKKEMRTYGNYELSPSEFYDIRCKNYIDMIQEKWIGDPWIIKDLVDFVNDEDRHYKLDAL